MPRRLVKKRSADREPSSHPRTRRTTKRPKRNKSLVDEEVGDFIVIDTGTTGDTETIGETGTVEDTGTIRGTVVVDEEVGDFIVVDTGTTGDTETIGETGTVEDTGTIRDTVAVEDENPTTSTSVDSDAVRATLQGNGTTVQSKHRKLDTNSDATQKARDALFVLDSAPDFVEKERNRQQNSISLYIPPPDGESQQSRITRRSINTHQSVSATESSSGLAHLHNAEWSPPPTDAPDDCQRPPKSARLSSSSQELSPLAIPALKQCQPSPNTLPVRETEQSASASSAPRRIDKPPQSKLMAEGDHCSPKFSISGASIGWQTSQPASTDNPPPHHNGVLCLGAVRNDEVRTRSLTQGSDLPDDPQAFLQLPGQASRQNISAGEPWIGSLTSHHDQTAQQLRELRPDGASKASKSQGMTPLDPNELQRSSTGMTSTNNSILQESRLVQQPPPEQKPRTSLPVSNFPGPALSLSPTPFNFAGTGASHIHHHHALPLQSSVKPLPKPSNSPQPRIPAINNRTNGTLSTADARLVHIFTTHAIVLLRLDNLPTRDYPASVIMWRTLQNFYQWYITETRGAEISVLKFKLLDDSGKLEREFLLPEGDLQRFQTLNQYIWDCFWVVVSMSGGAARFRILITPLRLADEVASHSSQAPGCNGGNATASAFLASPLPTSSLENIRVVADRPLPATTVTRRHYGSPSPYPPPSRPDNDNTTTPQQVRSIPAQVNHVSCQPLKSIRDPFPSHHNSMWMNVITGVFETSRTAIDKKRLRDRAAELIAGREDVELEEDETTGGRKRVYPDACGVVVDKSSAKGLVAITVHGFSVQQVDTGQGLSGEPYTELTIGVGETCVIHGSSTVLYYKPRKVPASDHAQPYQLRAATQPREPSIHELVKLASSPPEIAVRLQMDEVGKFSAPYEFSVWGRKIKTTEFFAWFGRQTGRGGVKGPSLLTFTLKDAMPDRKSRDIAVFDEDDFRWMRKHILTQFDKAKLFMPGLKDFTVLVTDPGWISHSKRR